VTRELCAGFIFLSEVDVAGAEIKSLADRLAELTVKQANDLAGYLKEAYRIEAPAATVSRVPKQSVTPDFDYVPSTVDVLLKSAGDKKIQVIRVVRQYTSLGLKEAKDAVDGAPRVILSGIDREQAEKIRKDLEDQGAAVELK
jgi:large subunit ribosomal protein L7/L12